MGSRTAVNLTRAERDAAMAEAVADVFALGECDALFVPSYSSFSQIGIIQMRAERKRVFFMDKALNYVEFPYPNSTDQRSRVQNEAMQEVVT